MARKFLYVFAALVVIYLGGRLALQFYPGALSRLAFVPSGPFEAQPALAANRYDDPAMWYSRPGAPNDPAKVTLQNAPAPVPVRAAVFFVHPTSYLVKSHWNAPLDDADADHRARLFLNGEASPFAGAEQIWAPRYRQAAFGAFLTDQTEGKQALELAYRDVAQAFDHFLTQIPADMPIVLAGHSQGAFHLRRLIAERIAGKPVARRIAAAYLVGWPISIDHDLPVMGLPACASANQSGCVMSWQSYANPADPALMIEAYGRYPGLDGKSLKGCAFLCSNPLTGGIGGSAPATANLGTLYPGAKLEGGEIKPGTVPAACQADGTLSIGTAPDLGDYVLPGNNYHVYDIPLFWANLRADFARRTAAPHP